LRIAAYTEDRVVPNQTVTTAQSREKQRFKCAESNLRFTTEVIRKKKTTKKNNVKRRSSSAKGSNKKAFNANALLYEIHHKSGSKSLIKN